VVLIKQEKEEIVAKLKKEEIVEKLKEENNYIKIYILIYSIKIYIMSEEILNKLFTNHSLNYVFIYTPPKVGSTTLVSSLRISLGNTFSVIHIHDDIMLNVLTGINNITVNEIINYISQKGKTVYVIDVYRTPIERKMSEFFEKISPYHFNNSEENVNNYSIKRVTDRFNKLFTHLSVGDHYFDKYNIANPTPFDFEKKYTIQYINNVRYVKLRLHDSKLWGNILSSIFEQEVVLINDYQTTNKCIGDLYKRFKDEYKIPANYIELINNCKYLNFYFSIEERNQYIQNWINKIEYVIMTPYTNSEYKFYVNLYLENQYINDIQTEHYIDNGCLCICCSKIRKEIFTRAKNGETQFDKIIHQESVAKHQDGVAKSLIKKIKGHKSNLKTSNNSKQNNKYGINFGNMSN